ncbi:MAG TPA: MFS transporter [Candidatus Deferrimicrobiaceae bacterium]|jgi:MFS family permease|nr:MFS transporter [Candidatus Deferrimicrobiaceae bacterium]
MRTALPPQIQPVHASTFQALRHRNFRLWFFGQLTSLVGTWMQIIAQNWLVYQLTGSAWDLGVVNFVGAIPLVPLTLHAGAIADRFSKRRIIFLTQASMMALAFVLAVLCVTGAVRLWHVIGLAFLLGAVQAIDTPARQAFVIELVGREDLANAIALNSGTFHGARVIGPAVAGILVASIGVSGAFFLNGASFLAVLGALFLMDATLIRRAQPDGKSRVDLWGGARYIARNRAPGSIVLLISLSAFLAMPYYVLVPIFAKEVLGGGAGVYGGLMSAAGVGAVLGSLYAASGGAVRRKGMLLAAGSLSFPVFVLAFSLSRHYPVSVLLMAAIGFAFVIQNAPANSLLQTLVPDPLRGRVMAIYVFLFLGLMRVGGLLVGLLASATSATTALAIAGAASLAASLLVMGKFPELRRME